MRPARGLLAATAALTVAATLVAGCGSSTGTTSVNSKTSTTSAYKNYSDTTTAPTTGDTTDTTMATTETTAVTGGAKAPSVPQTPANAKGCRTAQQAAAQTKAPAIAAPAKAETSIRVVDNIPGCGALATSSSKVKVQYILKAKSTGQVVDSSWSRNQPFDLTLGQGSVISGWELGIPGMRVGGERTLYLGPTYGYGPAGSPPSIGANDTLVFVIDLLSVS